MSLPSVSSQIYEEYCKSVADLKEPESLRSFSPEAVNRLTLTTLILKNKLTLSIDVLNI